MKTFVYISAFALIVFFACSKKGLLENNRAVYDLREAANAWLEAKKDTSQSNARWIDSLKSSVQWTYAIIRSFRKTEKISVVPLNLVRIVSPLSESSQGQNYLVIIQGEDGKIRVGEIVKLGNNHISSSGEAANFISNILNANGEGYSGYFTVLSIYKQLELELNYQNDKLASFARPRFAPASQNSLPTATVRNCTDWFLVTTYYWSDGSTTTSRDYVYTMCNGQMTREPDGGAPGNGNPTSNVDMVDFNPVKDSIVDPCLSAAIHKVTTVCMENLITQLYTDSYLGYNHQFNLTLTQNATRQDPAATATNPSHPNDVTITFNKAALNANASQETWASVYIHELIHSFIYQNNLSGDFSTTSFQDHQNMVTDWVNNFANLLISIFPNLSVSQANVLALSGVGDVLLVNDLTPQPTWNAYVQSKYGVSVDDVTTTNDQFIAGTLGTHCP